MTFVKGEVAGNDTQNDFQIYNFRTNMLKPISKGLITLLIINECLILPLLRFLYNEAKNDEHCNCNALTLLYDDNFSNYIQDLNQPKVFTMIIIIQKEPFKTELQHY